jgi:ketosteroid isomerase-like protein
LQKRLFVIIIVTFIFTLLLAGCANAEQRAILSTVRQYVKLLNAEDAGGVFGITHQKVRSLGYKNSLDLQFAKYDVKFKLEELKFEKIENDYAYVSFVATMIKNDDSDFQNVRITGTFVLAKENDAWKILMMTQDKSENLN